MPPLCIGTLLPSAYVLLEPQLAKADTLSERQPENLCRALSATGDLITSYATSLRAPQVY
jgi:membrane carboxypeptidase/penicillin-binding protein